MPNSRTGAPVGGVPAGGAALVPSGPLEAPGAPYITVVIMTWQRRQYIERALESVLAQTLPRSEYEIVVVKGYVDPSFDARLQACGARSHLTSGPDQGPAIARAVELARGEVITFLDDDDEFEPSKLVALRAEFLRDPSLVLLRHRNQNIDAAGRPLPSWPVCEWPATTVGQTATIRTDREKVDGPILPMYNLTTMAIRRSPLLAFLPSFRAARAGADSLVFLAALSTTGAIRIDSRPLSRHRIHPSASMETFSGQGLVPPPDPRHLTRALESLRFQEAMVRGTSAERSAHFLYLITRFDACMSLPSFPLPGWREHVEFVRFSLHERQPFRLMIVLFALARRIAPQWAIRRWWAIGRRKHRRAVGDLDYAQLFPTPRRPAAPTSTGNVD